MEDKRLQQVNNAALGANEGTGADGGFLIQTDFAGQILESAVQQQPPAQPAGPLHLLQRGQRHAVAERGRDRRVASRCSAGCRCTGPARRGTVAASQPQFREMKHGSGEDDGLCLLPPTRCSQDAAFMTGFFGSAFSLAADRLLTGERHLRRRRGQAPGPAPLQGAADGGQGEQPGGGHLYRGQRASRCWPGPCPGTGTAWCG